MSTRTAPRQRVRWGVARNLEPRSALLVDPIGEVAVTPGLVAAARSPGVVPRTTRCPWPASRRPYWSPCGGMWNRDHDRGAGRGAGPPVAAAPRCEIGRATT